VKAFTAFVVIFCVMPQFVTAGEKSGRKSRSPADEVQNPVVKTCKRVNSTSEVKAVLNYAPERDPSQPSNSYVHYKTLGTLTVSLNGKSETIPVLNTTATQDYFIAAADQFDSGRLHDGVYHDVTTLKLFPVEGSPQALLDSNGTLYLLECDK
jgi:hypothetical protein